jgi:hypothetical protein
MLLSCILGDQSKVSNDWEIITDEYENVFIANDSIRQRIRLGKKVADTLNKVYSSANTAGYEMISGYEIAQNIVFSNNNKNMNLSLLGFWSKNRNEKKNHVDKHIVYVTLVSKNYLLLGYDEKDNRIIQTYRKLDKNDPDATLQGCGIEYNAFGTDVISLRVWDISANRYALITISTDEEGKLLINKDYDLDKSEFKEMKNIRKNLGKRLVHFKITCKKGYLPTSTYIVNGLVEGLAEKVQELTADVPNAQIIVLPAGDTTFKDGTEEEIAAINDMFDEALLQNRIKAVTLIGVSLPPDYCRKYKLLYQFRFNENTERIECIRSN